MKREKWRGCRTEHWGTPVVRLQCSETDHLWGTLNWKAKVRPAEVGSPELWKSGGQWLWMKRKESTWAPKWVNTIWRVTLGCRESLLNPLEVLWTYQRNIEERGCPLDNPGDAITHLTTLLSLGSTKVCRTSTTLYSGGRGLGEQPEPNPSQSAAEKEIQAQKPLVKWPKSCKKVEWEEVNVDLCNILETLRGTTMRKLERMGKLICSYRAEHFGAVEKTKLTSTILTKSRR